MRLVLPLSLALAGLFALSACATPSQEPPPAEDSADGFAAPPPPPAMDEAGPIEETAMSCDVKPGQWSVGQIADDALVAKVKADTGSDRIRVIRPGMAVTMDHREDRVNLEVDAENRVLTIRCG